MTTKHKTAAIVLSIILVLLTIYPWLLELGISSTPLAGVRRWSNHTQTKLHGNKMAIKIGIIITEASGYAQFTASVLKSYHQISGHDISVYIYNKTAQNERQITEWYGNGITVTALPTFEDSLRTIFEEFIEQDKHETLFLVDSNMVFLPSWKDFIIKHMVTSNQTIQLLSLYHAGKMHNFDNDCEKLVGYDLCEGPLHAKLGIAISRSFAHIILQNHLRLLEKYNWDEILRMENFPLLYSRKSHIIKIEKTTPTDDFCGENDIPYGFNSCKLPIWIRDGLEFYMDRCTNSQEKYVPGISLEQANSQNRSWTRPTISYSLYGNKSNYWDGALANSRRVYSIYPGWKVWMYFDNTVPINIIDKLCEQNVKFINMTGKDIINKMSWRFLVASEPVPMYAIRDLDSKLITRGKAAVDEWIKSGRNFHVMRDHRLHAAHSMNGGMWGGKVAISDMENMIRTYRGRNAYMTDMKFLHCVVWNIVKKSVWAHDSHSRHIFGEDHPFPTPLNSSQFVGRKDFW